MKEKLKDVEKGCSNDACFHVKKAIVATKEVVEEIFKNLVKDYPGMVIEETFIEQDGELIPKIGIFPSSIITLPASTKLPQPLKIMIFINVLKAQEKEIELSYGWTFGPGAEEAKERVYVKLLNVVSVIKEEKGALYRGILDHDIIQPKIEQLFRDILQEYQHLLEDLGL